MYNDKIEFTVNTALYNAVDNSIFVRNKLSNKVNTIFDDNNNLNLKIHNENRLKQTLFSEIHDRYNNRINNYKLNLARLSLSDMNNMKIKKFSLNNNDLKVTSGFYSVFPKTFYCEKCGDLKILSQKEIDSFNINKCARPNCDGKYAQFKLVAFCEQCGKINNIFKSCENHGKEFLKLHRKDPDLPTTWSISCTACNDGIHDTDLMSICNHTKEFSDIKICEERSTKYKPIDIKGGVYKSVVITTVDVPENNESDFIDEIYLGSFLGVWNEIDFLEDMDDFEKVEEINFYLETLKEYPDKEAQQKAIKRGFSEEIFIKANLIKSEILGLREIYQDLSISTINDYLTLKERFSKDSSNQVFEVNDDSIFNELGIEEITYIPKIQLISSSIGYIKGINKFSDSKFVPHFEPHWSRNDENKFHVYVYPFETEGIMFDLDKVKIVNWIIDNSTNPRPHIENEEGAINFLFNLNEESEDYDNLKMLIHTFAHILIKRSSLYTGLNDDSCGELLFPKSGAFLIYSTSSLNIGGFSFVFENSLEDWFKDIKLDIDDCIFDPVCMDEEGACFSCIYLPEFVCCDFNNFLDRDVFLGKSRFDKGFWI